MKANALLKWLVPGALVVVVLIMLRSWVNSPVPDSANSPAEPDAVELTAEQAKSLGVAGDTPRDTVATLVGQVKAMRTEMLSLKKSNDSLQTENNRLRSRESNIDSRIQSTLGSVTQQVNEERNQANQARQKAEQDSREARSLLSQLKDQLSGLSNKAEDLPVGFGLEPGDSKQFGGGAADAGTRWIEPSDQLPTGKVASEGAKSPTALSSFKLPGLENNAIGRGQKQLRATAKGERDLDNRSDRSEGARPVYTLPENATLMGSVAMTALIGRVPVDGTVNDPYPFKVLVGPENLTANGIELPDVVGAVISGTASGDWTLSCVRGQVESITFVFQDGTVRTEPQPQAVVSRNASTTQTSDTDKIRGGLGFISDPYGIPCIAGERRSNAQQYLGSQSLITAAGAGIASVLGSDQTSTSVISSGSSALGLSQSNGNSALNSVLSGGISDIREWVNKLYGEAFAAVYVPPSAKVAVHLDHEITIDYEPKGRKVNHETPSVSSLELD